MTIIRQRAQLSTKSEFQLILEFIGYRNLAILGLLGGLYFASGVWNMSKGLSLMDAFSPFYVLHFHDGGRLIDQTGRAFWEWMHHVQEIIVLYYQKAKGQFLELFDQRIRPFFAVHPFIGIFLLLGIGFLISVVLLATFILIVKKILYYLAIGSAVVARPGGRLQQKEELWTFDPRRKPSADQLRIAQKNLEKLVLRAPVLGGHVPKNADSSLRELAKRNRDSDFNYRNAIYTMGPIKGTKLDQTYEIPIALDQVKKISNLIGLASEYETLPLDLVILRARKGSNNWEVEPSIAPVNLGKMFPVKVIEKVMTQNRNTFIWDQRASKSRTGYGTR